MTQKTREESATKQLAKLLATECRTTGDIQNKLKELFGGTLQEMLEAEMDEHLGYDKHSPDGDGSGNSRNGYSKKTVSSQFGESEILIPRDRNSEFEPQIVPKHQTKGEDIEKRVLAMYAKGLSTHDIEDHLRDIYGVEASASLISKITDKILPQAVEWQNRPLERVYPVVFFDGIYFKMRRDGKIQNTCVYTVLGINADGYKEILGLWIGENESASFWTQVCNDLKNRGVERIFIACHDNLNGFGKAINTVFPQTNSQLCIIHQIRNSTKYVSYKDLKPLMADLKMVYGSATLDDAEFQLEVFAERWDKKYPQISKSWRDNWTDLTEYFKYPGEVRHLIYTTNAVEGFHRMLRKTTKNKGSFPTEDALRKSIYLSICEISKKWTMPIRYWGQISGQFCIFFEDDGKTDIA